MRGFSLFFKTHNTIIMKRLTGQIVSDKMKKTVVVEVILTRIHSKYHKTYQIGRRFKAHDEAGVYKVGDTVVIEETRPLSREKRWKVVEKITVPEKKESHNALAEKAISS